MFSCTPPGLYSGNKKIPLPLLVLCGHLPFEMVTRFQKTKVMIVCGRRSIKKKKARNHSVNDFWLYLIPFLNDLGKSNCFRFLIYIKKVPVFFFGNLGIQARHILSDIFSFLLPDFLCYIIIPLPLCIIQNIKPYGISFPLCFCQYAVFPFRLLFDSYIVLSYPFQHVMAFTNINDSIIDFDAVNSCMVIFFSKALPL